MELLALLIFGQIELFAVAIGIPAGILFLSRSLRYAYRWAAIVTLVGIAVGMLGLLILLAYLMSGSTETSPAAIALVAGTAIALGTLSWPIGLGIHATFALRHLDLGHPDIDAVSCVRFRTRKPPVTWSPAKLLGSAALVSAPILFAFLVLAALPTGTVANVLVLLGAPALAAWLWPLARRRWQASAREARLRDWRPPVLLLRSFKDDLMMLKASRISADQGKTRSFEELITGNLWCQGPVIAIGRPEETVPPVGAARAYFSDDQWQTEAERMVQQADTIAMLVGETEGLGWEFRRVQDLEMLQKLVLVFPPVERAESTPRWEAFCEQLGQLELAGALRNLPSSHLLMTVFSATNEPVAFTIAERTAHAYQLGLGAAIQGRGRRLAEVD